MHKIIKIITLIYLFINATIIQAEPTITDLKIYYIRSMASGDIYIQTDANSNLCDTSVFRLASSTPNKKELYAAALAAQLSGKKISIEISNATGCTGWGTEVESIYVLS